MAPNYQSRMGQPNTQMAGFGLADIAHAANVGVQAANNIKQAEQSVRANVMNERAALAQLPNQLLAAEEALKAQAIQNQTNMAMAPVQLAQAQETLEALEYQNDITNMKLESGLVANEIAMRNQEIALNKAQTAQLGRNAQVADFIAGDGQQIFNTITADNKNQAVLFSADADRWLETVKQSTDPNVQNQVAFLQKSRSDYITEMASVLQNDMNSVAPLPENATQEQIDTATQRKEQYLLTKQQVEQNPVVKQLIDKEILNLRQQSAVSQQVEFAAIRQQAEKLYPGNPNMQQEYIEMTTVARDLGQRLSLGNDQQQLLEMRTQAAFQMGQQNVQRFFQMPEITESMTNWRNLSIEEQQKLRTDLQEKFIAQFVPADRPQAERDAFVGAFDIHVARLEMKNDRNAIAQLEQQSIVAQKQREEGLAGTGVTSNDTFGSIKLNNASTAERGWWTSLFTIGDNPDTVNDVGLFRPTPYKEDFDAELSMRIGGLQRQMAEVNKVVDPEQRAKLQSGLRRRLQILQETKRELASGGFVNLIPNDIQTEVEALLDQFKTAGRLRSGWAFDHIEANEEFYTLNNMLNGYFTVEDDQQSAIAAETIARRNRIEMNERLIAATQASVALRHGSPAVGAGTTGLPIGQLPE